MPEAQHRKLAAIMFTDLVGYTALMATDEGKALDLLQRNRKLLKPLIKSHHGEWLKEIGDGTLSSFSSAVEAVTCALDIQRTLKDDAELRLRIGIHVGDVVFSEGDVFGDGVNVASRIEPLADPGGICISDRVQDDIKNKPEIKTTFLGNKSLKGVSSPVKVYAMVSKDLPAIPARGSDTRAPSIAVLPFTNMSADPENEYFCDGMTEELIDAFAKVVGLKVVARTSAFQFKEGTHDIREIGRRLGVSTILEGSVRKVGNRVRITTQLVSAVDGYHLWSEKYDRELEDIFEIQDEIAKTVVDSLKIKLVGEHKEKIVKQSTSSMEAYTLFLKGNFECHRQTPDSLQAGIEYFKRAIDTDPAFALAYASLADAFVEMTLFGGMHPSQTTPQAKTAARQAVNIDPELAEAHGALGAIAFYYDWDWELAESEFEKALALKPSSAIVHLNYAQCELILRKFDSAVAQLQAALDLDPLSIAVRCYHGFFHSWLGKLDEAIALLEQTVEMDPNFHFSHHFLGILHAWNGRLEESLLQHERARALADIPSAKMMHAYALGLAGRREEALELIGELERGATAGAAWAFFIAVGYIGVGEIETGLDWLDKAVEERNPSMPFISLDRMSDPLRDHPRFKDVLKKMNLQ